MAKPTPLKTRSFKRGEQIFPPRSSPTHFYLIQTGLVSVCLVKDGCVQVHYAGPGECIREEVLLPGPPTGMGAIAIRRTEVFEIPVDLVRSHLETCTAQMNQLTKGLMERLRTTIAELRALKVNRSAWPCPPEAAAKVFGVIFHTARHFGKKEGESIGVDWPALQNYATEVFLEDPVRLQDAIHVLTNLGYAEPIGPEPAEPGKVEAPELWKRVLFRNMTQIETFFDFYQNYHYKPGSAEMLKTNEKITELTEAFLKVGQNYAPDRQGMVTMPYKATVERLKEVLGKYFEADQIFRLEQKGLIVKRTATQEGGMLSFLKPEFEQMLLNWKVLKQIEQWNEKGYVEIAAANAPDKNGAVTTSPAEGVSDAEKSPDIDDWQPIVLTGVIPKIRTTPPQPNESLCPVCMSAVTAAQRYCSVCDSEIPKKAS